jgi:hypothetical protein
MTIASRLAEAIRDGEILTVVYDGGSQPGRKRQISPIRLTEGMVIARCIASGRVKWYGLDKMEVTATDHPAPAYDPSLENAQRDADAIVLALEHYDRIIKNGWHIVISETSIGLHDYHKKQGTPLKYPSICLARTGEEYARPWSVRGPTRGNGYIDPGKAAAAFIEEAEKHSPSTVKSSKKAIKSN